MKREDAYVCVTFHESRFTLGSLDQDCNLCLTGPFCGSQSGRPSRDPSPREVISANRPKDVQHFAAQKQTGVQPALERSRIEFVEGYPSARDLRLLVAFVAVPGSNSK